MRSHRCSETCKAPLEAGAALSFPRQDLALSPDAMALPAFQIWDRRLSEEEKTRASANISSYRETRKGRKALKGRHCVSRPMKQEEQASSSPALPSPEAQAGLEFTAPGFCGQG